MVICVLLPYCVPEQKKIDGNSNKKIKLRDNPRKIYDDARLGSLLGGCPIVSLPYDVNYKNIAPGMFLQSCVHTFSVINLLYC